MRILIVMLMSAMIATQPVAAEPKVKEGGAVTMFGIYYISSIILAIGLGWWAKKTVDIYEAEQMLQKSCSIVSDNEIECDMAVAAKEGGVDCEPSGAGKVRCRVHPSIVDELR